MKKDTITLSKFFVVVLLAYCFQALDAQEIIAIDEGWDNNGPTLLPRIIGDTLDNGERAHPNVIYRLKRGVIYPVRDGLFIDFDVTIDALDGEGRPPMITPFMNDVPELPDNLIIATTTNNLTLKNLLFNAVPSSSSKDIALNAVKVNRGKTVVDNCIFNGFTWGGVDAGGGDGFNVTITNSIFRNIQEPLNWWEGDPVAAWATDGDTLIIRNSTYFNCNGAMVLHGWDNQFSNYSEFSNNTVYGGTFLPVPSFSWNNGKIENNLFMDTYVMGIDKEGEAAGWCDGSDALTSPIVQMWVNDPAKMESIGLTEAKRKVEINNNVYFWSQGVRDHWASRGDQFPETVAVFMNSRGIDMFADEANYPLLNAANNIEVDPEMVDTEMMAEVIEGYANYSNGIFDFRGPEAIPFDGYLHWYPGVDGAPSGTGMEAEDLIFDIEWPLAEDLSFTSATVLTAATDGGAVGDPRWVGVTGINKNIINKSDLGVSNYPNPFTNSTIIKYTVKDASIVKLSVFDISGREVAVLVNEDQAAGTYKKEWKPGGQNGAPLQAGVYLIQLRNNKSVIIERMLLVK